MNRHSSWATLIACIVALIAPAGIALQLSGSGVSDNRDWPLTGGDAWNTRSSPLDQINVGNVKQLAGAWMSPEFDDGVSSRAMPVIKDGLVFVTAGSHVYALSAQNGKTIWKFSTDPKVTGAALSHDGGSSQAQIEDLSTSGYIVPNAQGVAVAEGKVFVGLANGHVMAVNEQTGELEWDKDATGQLKAKDEEGVVVPTAPTYANGMLFVGMSGGHGLRVGVVALDTKTGSEVWRFDVVPGPGQPGHGTWAKDNDVWKHGGGGVWQTGAVDPDLGIVYFGTGNPAPQYGGEIRAGNNLYTDCVVALDIKTGKLRWYYQLVHHDIWEADISQPVVLYDTEINGRAVKAIAAMRPDGYLFLLNRETGKPLVPIEERPVPQNTFQKTAATQPFPVVPEGLLPNCSSWKDSVPKGWTLDCEFLPWNFGATVVAPGFSVRVTPMSYSPQTGYIYAQGTASIRPRRLINDDPWFFALGDAGTALLGLPPARNFIAAIDGRTDKVVWKKEVSARELSRGYSAPLATAGGLLFHSTSDGKLEAYNAQTGDLLWQFQTSGQGGPIASYELDGEQYVAMVAGRSIWAFHLGGTIPPIQRERGEGSAGPADRGDRGAVDTDQIEVASLVRDNDNNGHRYAVDEHSFNPVRIRVKVGTRVIWLNNGRLTHTIVAQDGSWTVGTLEPADSGSTTFTKPGSYLYMCKEHPWALGEVIVEDNHDQRTTGLFSSVQAQRGRTAYMQNCSSCHQADLSGLEQAPALMGDAFLAQWIGHPLSDLVDRTRTTMPQGNPGSLSDAAYLDIISYLLQMNNFPEGPRELEPNSAALKSPIGK